MKSTGLHSDSVITKMWNVHLYENLIQLNDVGMFLIDQITFSIDFLKSYSKIIPKESGSIPETSYSNPCVEISILTCRKRRLLFILVRG